MWHRRNNRPNRAIYAIPRVFSKERIMKLFEKLIALYPTLTIAEFNPVFGTIRLQNDSDGRGDYIADWSHPTLPKPTQAQLDAI